MKNEKLIKVPEAIYKDINFLNKYHKEQFKNLESQEHLEIGQCVLIEQDHNGIIGGLHLNKLGTDIVYSVIEYSIYDHEYIWRYYGKRQILPIKRLEKLEEALENKIVRLTKDSIPDEDLQKYYNQHIERLKVLNDCTVTYIQESELITKNKQSILIYFCSRIIKFKNKPRNNIKTTLFSTLTQTHEKYIEQVKEHLLISNEEMQESIMEDIEKYRNDERIDYKKLDNIANMLSDINMTFNIK